MATTSHPLTILSPLAELDRRRWGTIAISRQALAYDIFRLKPQNDEAKARLEELQKRFGSKYDFYTFSVNVSVMPGDDLIGREFAVDHVEVSGTVNPTVEDIAQRPYVLSTGPESVFTDGDWKITAGIDVGFDPGSLLPKLVPLTAKVNFKTEYAWQERKVKATSGSGDGFKDLFWRFEKTKTDWPVGNNQCVVIVKKPKTFKEKIELKLEGDVEFVDRFPGWHRIRVPVPQSTVVVEVG